MRNAVMTALKAVRPLFVPILRLIVRHLPSRAGRRIFWERIVAPYFRFARYNFVAPTVFGCYLAGNTGDIIQRYIYYFGVWEPNLTHWISSRLKPGDVFVDVGANIGYFTVLASKLVGASGKVISIEASPKIFEHLMRNVHGNSAHNVEAHNIAVSNSAGKLKIFLGSETNIGETTILAGEGMEYECEVESRLLSDVVSREHWGKVRAVKIDVEGAEWFVVHGMTLILEHAPDNLEVVVEINPTALLQQQKCAEDILQTFSRFGFFPYGLVNDYSALSYLTAPAVQRPARIRTPVTSQVDVVFSKIDAEYL